MRALLRQLAALTVALLCASALHATVGESPVFIFDTRDSNSAHFAESAAFALDTRSSNSTHYNESAVFAFDTRAKDGLGGSGRSGTFVLDTRASLADGITLIGPAALSTGSVAEYRVAFRSGNSTADVTAESALSFVGTQPAWVSTGGMTVFVNRNAPGGTFTLRATWNPAAGGQYLSASLTVNVSKVFRAGMTATPQNAGGANYTVTLTGTAAGGLPPYTFRWDKDGNGTYGDVAGQSASFSLTDPNGGWHAVNLEVLDGNGNRAAVKGGFTVHRAPVVNEPVRITQPIRQPAGEVGSGDMFLPNGADFVFESDAARKANGFVLITHGLRSQALASAFGESWLQDMAGRIQSRTAGAVPNIALYDWKEFADPSGQPDPVKLAALEALNSLYGAAKLVNVAKAGLGALKKALLRKAAVKIIDAGFEELAGISLDAKGVALGADFLIDAWNVRPIAQAHGTILASWIWIQAKNGLIDPDKPIHLIGHSAGGFLTGECASFLRQHPLPNGKTVWVDRVTMLDTPAPIRGHFVNLPNPVTVDRFVGSFYGNIEMPGTDRVASTQYLRQRWLPDWDERFLFGDTGHGRAYRWYGWTIESHESDAAEFQSFGEQGFSLSPIINPATRIPRGPGFAALTVREAYSAASAGSGALVGFTAFGNVVESGGTFTVTEQANAGITKPLTIPIGTEALRFRFKFAAAGDGDFLEVRFGDEFPLYLALDTELTRDGFTEVEAPIDGLDGMTKLLTFTLVSRGAPNAVVQISDICLVKNDDPDGDGLTTTQEIALGTDPLKADTDGDGLSDSFELTIGTSPIKADTDGDGLTDGAEVAAGTNALDAASTFAVKQIQVNPGGTVTIAWEAQAGRIYRVLRSLTADFAEFDVIASGVLSVLPLTSLTDTGIDTTTTAKAFYRVQAE